MVVRSTSIRLDSDTMTDAELDAASDHIDDLIHEIREILAEIERQSEEEPAWLVSAALSEASLDDCDVWRAPPADPSVTDPVHSEVPTLILAGRFDPITPPEWGRRAAAGLDRSYFRELPAAGHGVSLEGCAGEIVDAFLDDPTTEPDPGCVDQLGPPQWILPE